MYLASGDPKADCGAVQNFSGRATYVQEQRDKAASAERWTGFILSLPSPGSICICLILFNLTPSLHDRPICIIVAGSVPDKCLIPIPR